MKAMIFSDLITSRRWFLMLVGTTLLVAVFIAILTGGLYGSIGVCAAMVPFMYLFNISAYDEQNGWERYRLTLPISRRQVAYGRYASMLVICACSFVMAVVMGLAIGAVASLLPESVSTPGLRLTATSVAEIAGATLLTQALILFIASLTMPLILRFGMTKATRLAPVLMVLLLMGLVGLFGHTAPFVAVASTLEGMTALQISLMAVGFLAIVLILYWLSSLLSARLYERREL